MISPELFEKLFPSKGLSPQKYNLIKYRRELIDALNEFLPKYEINTYRRVCAFLATCGIETDYFKTSTEYASGADYEGRRDLGNTQKGDGRRFRGRGIIQTTGRFNYSRVDQRVGKKLGIDLLENPERLAEVRIAVESACIFWQENNLNKYADEKRFKELNGIVNRGNPNKTPLHWDKRNLLYSKCIRYIPQHFTFESEAENKDTNYQPVPIAGSLPENSTSDVQSDVLLNPAQGFKFDLSSAETHYNTASATLQRPAIKTVLQRAGFKLFGGLTTVWATTGGRIAIVISALVVAGVAGGIIYSYRKQLQLGYQLIKISIYEKITGGAK